MKNKTQSIRSRLLIWLTLPLIIFTIAMFVYKYFETNKKVNAFFDNTLYATGKSIENSIGIEYGLLIVDLPYFAIDLLSSDGEGYVFYSVIDVNRDKLLVGYKGLFIKELLGNKEKVFYNTVYAGAQLRAVSFKTSLSSAGKTYNAIITIAESTENRSFVINDILSSIFILMTAVVGFTIITSLIAVSKGLSPLNYLQNLIKKRDSRDLKPVSFDAPKEVEVMVNSINLLLQRSRDNIEYIEQFNSDVSHQLRTPIAELKMKLELAFEKNDKDYISLTALVNSMAHITEQLLLYAKTNPNTLNLNRFEKLNLSHLCKEYALKTAPRVYEKGFEFAYESLDEEIFINADFIMIESMLDNIINNSLYYAVDEENNPMGTITVSLERHNNTIWLNVKDEGNGLEKKDLKNIFNRFYRVDSLKTGSGLGLSIVKQIAQLHNATVEASNDKGLVISIVFPL